MSNTNDFMKATGFSGGVKFGGGDTGTDEINQPGYFGVKLNALTTTKTIKLPAGYIALGYLIAPGDTVPSAGTIDVGYTGALDTYLADAALTAPDAGVLLPARRSVDTDVIFNATGLVDGEVFVSLLIVVPKILR